MKVIYRDEQKIKEAHAELDRLPKRMSGLAQMWNDVPFLPPFNSEIFNSLYRGDQAGTEFFEQQIWDAYLQEAKKAHGGIVSGLRKEEIDFSRFYDREKVFNTVYSMGNRPPSIVNYSDLSYTPEGEPYVAKETYKKYEERFSVYDGQGANEAIVQAFQDVMQGIEILQTEASRLRREEDKRPKPVIAISKTGKVTVNPPGLVYGKPKKQSNGTTANQKTAKAAK